MNKQKIRMAISFHDGFGWSFSQQAVFCSESTPSTLLIVRVIVNPIWQPWEALLCVFPHVGSHLKSDTFFSAKDARRWIEERIYLFCTQNTEKNVAQI